MLYLRLGRRGGISKSSHGKIASGIRGRKGSPPVCEPLETRYLLYSVLAPVIPTGTFVATNYGAVGDGATNNIHAIQAAIAAAELNGGGTVEIPFVAGSANVYDTAPFQLNTSINLQIDPGVTLQALPYAQFQLISTGQETSFISGSGSNFEITGGGTIAGNASTWPAGAVSAGGPGLLSFSDATIVLVQNVTITNSPQAALNFLGTSDNITVDTVTINSDTGMTASDGIDVTGSAATTINNCNISVSGFNILVTPGAVTGIGPYGVNITNCAFGVGQGVADDATAGVVVNNCTFTGTTNGLLLLGPQYLEGYVGHNNYGVYDSDITMTNVQTPILVDVYYANGAYNMPADPSTVPSPSAAAETFPNNDWNDVVISNLTSVDNQPGSNAGIIYGAPEQQIGGNGDFTLSNVQIAASKGMQLDFTLGVNFDLNSWIHVANGPEFVGSADGTLSPYSALTNLRGFLVNGVGGYPR
jgi:polygalacturonase